MKDEIYFVYRDVHAEEFKKSTIYLCGINKVLYNTSRKRVDYSITLMLCRL